MKAMIACPHELNSRKQNNNPKGSITEGEQHRKLYAVVMLDFGVLGLNASATARVIWRW